MHLHDITYAPLPVLVILSLISLAIVAFLVAFLREMRAEKNLTRLQRLGQFPPVALLVAMLVVYAIALVHLGHTEKQRQADEKVQEAHIARLSQASGVSKAALQDMPEHEGDQFTVRVRGTERTCVTTADFTELFCTGLERVIITK